MRQVVERTGARPGLGSCPAQLRSGQRGGRTPALLATCPGVTGAAPANGMATSRRGQAATGLSELRAALAGSDPQPIVASREAVTWRPRSAWVDARRWLPRRAPRTTRLPGRGATDRRRAARGPVHRGAGFRPVAPAERQRFRLIACSLHARLMECAERRGSLEEALTSGLKLLSLDPLQETRPPRADAALCSARAARRGPGAVRKMPARALDAARRAAGGRDRGACPLDTRRAAASRAREGPADADRSAPELANDRRPTHSAEPAIDRRPAVHVGRRAIEEGGYFAEGVADDIITELSRNKDLFVVARHSSFHIAQHERATPPPSARRSACAISSPAPSAAPASACGSRSTSVECESGREAWAERYDRGLEDLFDVQLEVAAP